MIFGTQPGDDWVPADFKLLEAYQTLQDETCGHCGHPIWLCRSTESGVQFEVRTDTCFANKSMQEWNEAQKNKKSKKEAPGEHPYTVPFTYDPDNNMEPSYTKLPSRRAYFEENDAV